jgi:predicted oxidoreductase
LETDTPDKLAKIIEGCCALGITSFDHADIYGGGEAETHFGAALHASGLARDEIQLISKCGIQPMGENYPGNRVKHYDSSPAHIVRSIDRSLKALGTEYLDLLLLHRPDPLMQAEETARALERSMQAGKVRAVGVSNFSPSQFALLERFIPLATNQIECSLMHLDPLEDGTLDQAQNIGFRPMIWSPLGGGQLFAPEEERGRRVTEVLHQLGQRYDEQPSVIALAWLLAMPSRPLPILGSGRLDRLRTYCRAGDLSLSRQDWFILYEASRGYPVA